MLSAALAVTFAAILLSTHAVLAEWDLSKMLKTWQGNINSGALQSTSKLDSQQQRMEQAMLNMMMKHYERATRCLAHLMALVSLWFFYRLQQAPEMGTMAQFLVVLLQYAMCWWVVRCRLTFGKLRLLTLVSHVLHSFFVAHTHWSEVADFSFLSAFTAAVRVCIAAIIHDPPVIIPCQTFLGVVEVICYFGSQDSRAGPLSHFLCLQVVILALACGVTVMVQEWARACIKACFESADSTLCLEAFQRVLRSICDAEVVLDENFCIQGDDSRLRRVLATPTDLRGVKFTDLLDQADKAQFEAFIRKSTSASQHPEAQDNVEGSIPPCLRVSLPSAYSQVGVDLFHVALPQLLDAEGPHHLLAITEDPESRQHPEATLGAIPEALCMFSEDSVRTSSVESEADYSRGSLGSSVLCRVAPVPELRDLTLLVDGSTDTQDVLQVHAKFKRDRTLPNDIHSHMPCLQSMLRPTDWLTVRTRVAKFAHEQHIAGAPESEELPPVMLRRLDDQHKFLAANTVSLATCRGQESSKKSSLIWVYVRDFVNDEAQNRLQPEHLGTRRLHANGGASYRG